MKIVEREKKKIRHRTKVLMPGLALPSCLRQKPFRSLLKPFTARRFHFWTPIFFFSDIHCFAMIVKNVSKPIFNVKESFNKDKKDKTSGNTKQWRNTHGKRQIYSWSESTKQLIHSSCSILRSWYQVDLYVNIDMKNKSMKISETPCPFLDRAICIVHSVHRTKRK